MPVPLSIDLWTIDLWTIDLRQRILAAHEAKGTSPCSGSNHLKD